MADDARPYWMLIAVLQSTVPLAEALAMRLYQAARDLHERQAGKTRLTGDLATGELRRMGKDLLIGSVGGPGFEASLDTPSGSGLVRFVLTRQGLGEDEPEPHESPSPKSHRKAPVRRLLN